MCGDGHRNLGPADVAIGGGGGSKPDSPVTNGNGNGGSDSMLRLPQHQLLQVGNMGRSAMYSAAPQPAAGGYGGGGRSMPMLPPGSQPGGYGGGGGAGLGLEPYGMGPGPGFMVYCDGRMQPQLPVHMMRGSQQMYAHQARAPLKPSNGTHPDTGMPLLVSCRAVVSQCASITLSRWENGTRNP